jgi:hemerythrin
MVSPTLVIRWGKHYELGHKKLDGEHEDLIDLLNSLYSLWQEGAPRITLQASLDALVADLLAHFRSEERFMARHHYVRLKSHKAEHDGFAAKLRAFQRAFRKNEVSLTEAMFRQIAAWLRNHLLVSDKPLKDIAQKGACSARR